jgi:effector-binding domain-containing protein
VGEPDPVAVVEVESRATVVIALVTDWERFPSQWPALLAEVWEAVRAAGVDAGRNVMLYTDDRPAVEVGVELRGPLEPSGRLTSSSLPAGLAATTTDHGPPTRESLRAAHHAIADFCERNGRRRAGPRWEIYSHHSEVAQENNTEVYHLLAQPGHGQRPS